MLPAFHLPALDSLLSFLPLVLAVTVVVTLALGRVSSRVEGRVATVAYRLFGTVRIEADAERRRRLRMAGIGTPYRVYASETYLYATAAALVGTVTGIYLGAAVVRFVGVAALAERVPDGPFRSMPAVLLSLSVKQFLVLAVASVLSTTLVTVLPDPLVRWLPGIVDPASAVLNVLVFLVRPSLFGVEWRMLALVGVGAAISFAAGTALKRDAAR